MYNSLADMFVKTVDSHSEKNALRYRKKDGTKANITYGELYGSVNAFAKALAMRGLAGKHIAIFSENRYEWLIADLAILGLGGADIPRSTDSTREELTYIVTHSDAAAVIVENTRVLDKIRDVLPPAVPVIMFDDAGSPVLSFAALIEEGKAANGDDMAFYRRSAASVSRKDLATIIYTSGTTGIPKGVMLEHGNILHNVEALPGMVALSAADKLVSILPIWHIYERMICYAVVSVGAFSVYSSKRDVRTDLAEERPTVFISVPAIWINMHRTVMTRIHREHGLKRPLAQFLIRHSLRYIRYRRLMRNEMILYRDDTVRAHMKELHPGPFDGLFHALAGKLVYAKLQHATGGRLRLTISGGGALPMYAEDFFEAAGVPLAVGWGITETSPVLTVRLIEENIRGTAGKPVPGVAVEVRGADGKKLPDGDVGVLWVKGPNVMRGYYKEPERTATVIVNGWFNTGDIGAITKQGHVVIIGREKETIVLVSGENVEPVPIEDKLTESPFIEQAMLAGQDKEYITALIVPNADNLSHHFGDGTAVSHKDIIAHAGTYEMIKAEIERLVNSLARVKSYERIVRFSLVEEPFSIENGLLTQSMKMKRNLIAEKYRDVISRMYPARG
ncbi:MAG: long-chain fatty acid--CoA ligase [Spirochaetota bacterium]